MTVAYAVAAVQFLPKASSWMEKLRILLLAPILAPIAIPLATVGCIVLVAYVFARKVLQPEYGGDGHVGRIFKVLEGLLEANFEAVLGLFTCLAVQSLENCFH